MPDPTPAQRTLLAVTYAGFREATAWPMFAWLDARLDHDHDLDAEDIISGMPAGLVIRDPGGAQHGVVRLTASGVAFVEAAQDDCTYFVRLVRWLADRERSHDPESPTEPKPLKLGLEEIVAGAWGGTRPPSDARNRVLILLQMEGLANARTEREEVDGEAQERFVIEVDRWIRPYRDLDDMQDYVRRRPEPMTSRSIVSGGQILNVSQPTFWDPTRFTPTYLQLASTATTEPEVSGTYVFILMPFTSGWSANVKDLIDQACGRLAEKYEDLHWERADDMTTSGRITDQIITAIERADLVIADVTDSNPNVMFELGYAAALTRPIVLLNQSVGDSPFDIKDWRQIVYAMDKLGEARNELIRHLDANLHRIRERDDS